MAGHDHTPDLHEPPRTVIEPFIQVLADKGFTPIEKSLRLLSDKGRFGFLPLEKYDMPPAAPGTYLLNVDVVAGKSGNGDATILVLEEGIALFNKLLPAERKLAKARQKNLERLLQQL